MGSTGFGNGHNSLKALIGAAGIEPATYGLEDECPAFAKPFRCNILQAYWKSIVDDFIAVSFLKIPHLTQRAFLALEAPLYKLKTYEVPTLHTPIPFTVQPEPCGAWPGGYLEYSTPGLSRLWPVHNLPPGPESLRRVELELLSFPRGVARSPLPAELEDAQLVKDYNESALVLADSAKASAALSRRALQHILREKAGVKRGDLSGEIQQVLDSGKLPSDIADNLDAVRNIGNFATHPIKSKASGEIVEVEPNEAEWNLEVLEQLIDFYYVRPAVAKARRDELNAKLAAAGKPAIK